MKVYGLKSVSSFIRQDQPNLKKQLYNQIWYTLYMATPMNSYGDGIKFDEFCK